MRDYSEYEKLGASLTADNAQSVITSFLDYIKEDAAEHNALVEASKKSEERVEALKNENLDLFHRLLNHPVDTAGQPTAPEQEPEGDEFINAIFKNSGLNIKEDK